MGRMYEAKEYLLRFYAKYSKIVDKVWQFVLALLTFLYIKDHIGFLEPLTNLVITLGLALICTFLKPYMTVVIAAILTLLHLGTYASGSALVVGILMLVMFVAFFRFTPKQSMVLLLVPLAFNLHVPVWIPIIFGLVGEASCVVPIIFGTMIHYMLTYVESYATLFDSLASQNVLVQMRTFSEQFFESTEMWLVILSLVICILMVYSIRRLSIDYARMVATVVGILANLIMMTFGHVVMDVPVDYVNLIVSSLIVIPIAFVVCLIGFSADYSQCEYLQFEDDEHYYYVKAVPKVSMSVREKTVKKINARQETGTMDIEEIQKKIDESNAMDEQKAQLEESEIQRLIEEELNK